MVSSRVSQVDFLMGYIKVTRSDNGLVLIQLREVVSIAHIPLFPFWQSGQAVTSIRCIHRSKEEIIKLKGGNTAFAVHSRRSPYRWVGHHWLISLFIEDHGSRIAFSSWLLRGNPGIIIARKIMVQCFLMLFRRPSYWELGFLNSYNISIQLLNGLKDITRELSTWRFACKCRVKRVYIPGNKFHHITYIILLHL